MNMLVATGCRVRRRADPPRAGAAGCRVPGAGCWSPRAGAGRWSCRVLPGAGQRIHLGLVTHCGPGAGCPRSPDAGAAGAVMRSLGVPLVLSLALPGAGCRVLVTSGWCWVLRSSSTGRLGGCRVLPGLACQSLLRIVRNNVRGHEILRVAQGKGAPRPNPASTHLLTDSFIPRLGGRRGGGGRQRAGLDLGGWKDGRRDGLRRRYGQPHAIGGACGRFASWCECGCW